MLLFVLWYCHKRGREVRLEKDRQQTESETKAFNDVLTDTSSQTLPITALSEASNAEQGTSGMRAVQGAGAELGRPGQYAEVGSLARYEKGREKERVGEPLNTE